MVYGLFRGLGGVKYRDADKQKGILLNASEFMKIPGINQAYFSIP